MIDMNAVDKTVAPDESIFVGGRPATAGSKILEGFAAPFDAEVIARLKARGYIIADSVRTSEFNTGFENENAKPCGAVKALLDFKASYALCNDVFGGIGAQAAKYKLCCVRPAYGTVSRRGLIPLAPSMDQIGVLCRSPREGFELLSVIAGNDPGDGAMFPENEYKFERANKKIILGVPEQLKDKISLRFAGDFETVLFDFKYADVCKQVMQICVFAEAGASLSRYDGINFGFRASDYTNTDELYARTRSEGFGEGAKLASVLGAALLSKENYERYYVKAMKIRRLIRDSLRFGEEGFDVALFPADVCAEVAALSGLPSVTFSYRGEGIRLVAGIKREGALLEACLAKG